MKRIIFILLTTAISIAAHAQTDSTNIKEGLSPDQLEDAIYQIVGRANYVGRYDVIRTENIYTSLILDTATGEVNAVQIGMNNDSSRTKYQVCGPLNPEDDCLINGQLYTITGRYKLSPTGNMYNFILLDTIEGRTYQVQWSTKLSNCARWRIY